MSANNCRKAAGLLVIRRINYFSDDKYIGGEISPSIKMEHEEILKRYRGIEGEPWPIVNEFTEHKLLNGLAALNQLDSAIEYYSNASNKYLCDFIYIATNPTLFDYNRLPKKIVFCGYDFGVYESEFNCYSAIFNEALYGKYIKLRDFGEKLNDSLLLPTADLIANFNKVRNDLVQAGADLETSEEGEEFAPISVHRII